MTTLKSEFAAAILAEASYASGLGEGMTASVLSALLQRNDNSRLPSNLADHLGLNFTVLTQTHALPKALEVDGVLRMGEGGVRWETDLSEPEAAGSSSHGGSAA